MTTSAIIEAKFFQYGVCIYQALTLRDHINRNEIPHNFDLFIFSQVVDPNGGLDQNWSGYMSQNHTHEEKMIMMEDIMNGLFAKSDDLMFEIIELILGPWVTSSTAN